MKIYNSDNVQLKKSNGIYNIDSENNINGNLNDNLQNVKKEKEKNIKFKQKDNLEEKLNDFVDNAFENLDTKKIGLVTKSQLSTELKLDYDTIGVFGFTSKQDFIDKLDMFQTKLYNHLNKEELKNYLMENLNNKNKKINKKNFDKNNLENENEEKNTNINKQNQIENEEEEKEENEDDDYLPVYGVKNDSFDIDYEDEKNTRPESTKTQRNYQEKNISLPQINNNIKNLKNNNKPQSSKVRNDKKISYQDYKNVVNKYKSKDNINFTIPKPFSFDKRKTKGEIKSDDKKKQLKDERQKIENEILNKGFKANKLKNEIFIGNIDNFIEGEKKERQRRVEKRMQKIEKEMKPFSFVAKDEEKQKQKIEYLKKREKSKEKFPQFKANTIKFTTRVNMNVENWEEKEKIKRNERIQKKSKQLLEKSKLPPRLEQHEKEKIEKIKREEKVKKQLLKEEKREKSLSKISKKKDNEIKLPDYEKLQKNFEKKIQDQKNKAPKTIIEPFDFHDPVRKKNIDESNYIENIGFNFRKNAIEMIKNLNTNKNNYNEPSSNNALNKILSANRKANEKKVMDETAKGKCGLSDGVSSSLLSAYFPESHGYSENAGRQNRWF